MSTQTRLSTEALAVGYGGTVLIGDIALRVGAGRVLTLIGPNGSGKSTILKTLSGHLDLSWAVQCCWMGKRWNLIPAVSWPGNCRCC